MSRLLRLSILRTIVAACALVICARASGFDGSTIAPFGLKCKAELGALPLTWNCQDGTILQIDSARPCSNPPWLTLDNDPPNRCIKGARLLALTTDNSDTYVRVICRRYKERADPEKDKTYEDVAVVAHNNKTGKTCFFQALDRENGKDGTNVPSPMADASVPSERAVAERAAKFWKHPEELNNKALRCSLCHDNDAWMHTPYVDQVKGEDAVPHKKVDTWKAGAIQTPNLYSLVEEAFYVGITWPQPNSVLTAKVRVGENVEAQKCTECHRMADQKTKTLWLSWATDRETDPGKPPKITDQRSGMDWTQYRWMPDEATETSEEDWHRAYDKHIAAMKCCLDHPDYSGCAAMPIFGIKTGVEPTWGDAENGTCVDDTGNVALHVGIDSKVVGGRGPTDDSCDAPLDKKVSSTFQVTHANVAGESVTFTKDKANATLGYRVPNDPTYNPDSSLFPGDLLEVTIDDPTAWDAEHHLLNFDRWSDTDGGGPGNRNGCPCEDPSKTTCKFRTLGASNWFGANPSGPTFPGDPPNFQCIAQFKNVGNCQRPGHGSVPDSKRRLGGLIDCDCEHVSAGLLTGAYVRQCRGAESNLRQLVADGKFHLEVGADEKIKSGDVCDPVASGPSGWPLQGGPASPPPKANGPRCRYVGGTVQYQCE